MLGQRRRRWPHINLTLDYRLVFSEKPETHRCAANKPEKHGTLGDTGNQESANSFTSTFLYNSYVQRQTAVTAYFSSQ